MPPETANYEKGAISPDCRMATQKERVERAKQLLAEAGYGPGNPLTCEQFPTVSYDPSNAHILGTWAILIVYTAICLGITAWLLKRRDAEA